MQTEIKDNIINSKNYKNVCESVIIKTIERETPKYKKKKDIEQSVRAKLHAWVTIFYENYSKLLKNQTEKWDENFYLELLKTHISTKERFDFLEEIFKDIDQNVGNVNSILDLGAGFNPVAYFLKSKNKAVEYTAVDLEKTGADVLNLCFKQLGVNANALTGDVLDFSADKAFDTVFMFKLLPLLEQQRKGSSVELIKRIDFKYLCVTYPTKTLSGKNVGMYNKYKTDIENLIEKCDLKLTFEKEYKNEILFILKK